jgi:hypothetical protein
MGKLQLGRIDSTGSYRVPVNGPGGTLSTAALHIWGSRGKRWTTRLGISALGGINGSAHRLIGQGFIYSS